MSRSRVNFLRLGSRDSVLRRLGMARQAQLLNTVFKQGVPVPPGLFLLHEGWERLQADGIVAVDGGDVHVTSAETLLTTFALARLRQTVTVRAPAAAQQAAVTVTPGDSDRLIEVLVAAWRSAESPTTRRRDLLVMEAVPARQWGSAVTGRAEPIDHVTAADGATYALPPLRRWQQPDRALPPDVRRVQRLLQGVRRALSLAHDPGWRVEWADDGERCWLLGVDSAESP